VNVQVFETLRLFEAAKVVALTVSNRKACQQQDDGHSRNQGVQETKEQLAVHLAVHMRRSLGSLPKG
jgi:hypothetical protein